MPKPAINGTYKVYPRGFLGSVQSPTIERTSYPSNPSTGRMNYDVRLFDSSKSTKITANMTIDSLYREYVRRGSTSYDFREKVFIAALNAFGTRNIYEWYVAQFNGPSFGDTNRQFIDDTFKFIMTGRRNLPLTNWNSLVKADENNNGVTQLGEHAMKFFVGCRTINDRPIRNMSIAEFIQDWISAEGGFNDMLFTLFILFGVSD